jgi:hypothetical protein
MYFLAPSHTELGGDRGDAWSHRTLQLILVILLSASYGILVCVVPKRQIFFMCLGTCIGSSIVAFDTIWKCAYVHFSIRLAGLSLTLVDLSVMRKMASRLTVGAGRHTSQLTHVQIALFVAIALNAMGMLVAPGYPILAVIELALFVGLMAEGYTHYVAFERAVGDTFGLSKNLMPTPAMGNDAVQGSMMKGPASLNAKETRRIHSAKIKVCMNVRLIFLCCHLMLGFAILFSPLWPANVLSSRECQVLLCYSSRLS